MLPNVDFAAPHSVLRNKIAFRALFKNCQVVIIHGKLFSVLLFFAPIVAAVEQGMAQPRTLATRGHRHDSPLLLELRYNTMCGSEFLSIIVESFVVNSIAGGAHIKERFISVLINVGRTMR